MDKPKVGILTFHDGFNYGTYLQAYALQRTIRSLGYPNEFINYKPWKPWLKEYRWLLHRQRPARWVRNLKKVMRFRLAHSRLARGPFHVSPRALADGRYDIVVIGSDEVWNFRHPLFGFDATYFSHGLGRARVLSYAATFGSIDKETPVPDGVKLGLDHLDFISVRDANSLALARGLTGKPATVSLDPTLICDFPPPRRREKLQGYILVYATNLSDEAVAAVRDLSSRTGKPLLSIGFPNPWCHRNLVAFDPLRFPEFFRQADFVVTNMFHGTMFSLKHSRPFAVVSSPYRRHKIGSSLQLLGLEDRILPEDGSGLAFLYGEPVDYGRAGEALRKLKEESLEYLRTSLAACAALCGDVGAHAWTPAESGLPHVEALEEEELLDRA